MNDAPRTLRRGRHRGGPGRGEPGRPHPGGRAQHGDRGERTGRRRVLVLGVHAEQGAAAAGGGAGRRAPGARAGPRPPPGRWTSAAVLARRDAFTSHWKDDGQVDWLDSVGVDLVRGHGRLDGPRQVAVATPDGGTRTADRPARGRRLHRHHRGAARPAGAGRRRTRGPAGRPPAPRRCPRRLVVVGGGVVAVEMATAWQALGARVTVLVRGGELLPRMEPFAGELVADGLREAGAEVRFGVSVTSVAREGRTVRVGLDDGGELTADEILFAIGRSPHTGDLGLETVGLDPGRLARRGRHPPGDRRRRRLALRRRRRQPPRAADPSGQVPGPDRRGGDRRPRQGPSRWTTAPWGAHVATADTEAVPQVVFTDPEVASVGLTRGRGRAGGPPDPGGGLRPRPASRAPACTPTATAAGPGWSWTSTAGTWSA